MRLSSVERALEAMAYMEKGRPYGLRPDEAKRKLADELASIARELGIKPLVIGGLAVNHHGYPRFTADVDLLLSRPDAGKLLKRLKSESGWVRYHEGFKNTFLGVSVDLCVEGDRTSPDWDERFPAPRDLATTRVKPLPVPALAEVIALKAMSGRGRDDVDIMELLKRHPSRIAALHKAARTRLRTDEARKHLDAVVARAKDELARRGR